MRPPESADTCFDYIVIQYMLSRAKGESLQHSNFSLVDEAYSYNMNTADKREVKKIIFEYFDFLEDEWNKFQRERGL